MIYEIKCPSCDLEAEINLPLARYDEIAEGLLACVACGTAVKQIISKSLAVFMRSGFPKGWNEHIGPDPVYVRDKVHCKDLCQAGGMTSGTLENAV